MSAMHHDLLAQFIICHLEFMPGARSIRSRKRHPVTSVPHPSVIQRPAAIAAEQDDASQVTRPYHGVMKAWPGTVGRATQGPIGTIPLPRLAEARLSGHVSAKVNAPLPNRVICHRTMPPRRRTYRRRSLAPRGPVPLPRISQRAARPVGIAVATEQYDPVADRVVRHRMRVPRARHHPALRHQRANTEHEQCDEDAYHLGLSHGRTPCGSSAPCRPRVRRRVRKARKADAAEATAGQPTTGKAAHRPPPTRSAPVGRMARAQQHPIPLDSDRRSECPSSPRVTSPFFFPLARLDPAGPHCDEFARSDPTPLDAPGN